MRYSGAFSMRTFLSHGTANKQSYDGAVVDRQLILRKLISFLELSSNLQSKSILIRQSSSEPEKHGIQGPKYSLNLFSLDDPNALHPT